MRRTQREQGIHFFSGRSHPDSRGKEKGNQEGGYPKPGEVDFKKPEFQREKNIGCQKKGIAKAPSLYVSESDGESALARRAVFFSVSDIIDFNDNAGQESALDGWRNGRGVNGSGFVGKTDLYINRANHGNQSEEQEHEELSQPLVGKRQGASRIAVGQQQGGNAHGYNGPASLGNKRKGKAAGDQQAKNRRRVNGLAGEDSRGGHPQRTCARLCIRALVVVNGVVEKIGSDLDEQGGQNCPEREQGAPFCRHMPDDDAGGGNGDDRRGKCLGA